MSATILRFPMDPATLRVRLPRAVSSDPALALAFAPMLAPPDTYPATIRHGGAVCVVLSDGRSLGVKPGEFHFFCPWLPDGETVLADLGAGKKRWTVLPAVAGEADVGDGDRRQVLSASLERTETGWAWALSVSPSEKDR